MKGDVFRKLIGAGILAMAGGYAGQAGAVLIDVEQAGGWLQGSDVCVGCPGAIGFAGAQGGNAPAGTFSNISWVQGGAVLSNLQADTFAPTLDVPDDGSAASDFETITTLTHTNNVIPQAFDFLIDISTNLSFTDPDNNTFVDPDVITIDFDETFNAANIAACAADNTGTGVPCEDLFQFAVIDLSPLVVVLGDMTFDAEFQLANLNNAFFDPVSGTVFTAENNVSSLDVQVRLTKRVDVVPEPGTLALMGLGLVGIAFAAGRKSKV